MLGPAQCQELSTCLRFLTVWSWYFLEGPFRASPATEGATSEIAMCSLPGLEFVMLQMATAFSSYMYRVPRWSSHTDEFLKPPRNNAIATLVG